MASYLLWQDRIKLELDQAGTAYQPRPNGLRVGGFNKVKVVPYVEAASGAPTLKIKTAVIDHPDYYKSTFEKAISAAGIQDGAVLSSNNDAAAGASAKTLELFLKFEVQFTTAGICVLELHLIGYENS